MSPYSDCQLQSPANPSHHKILGDEHRAAPRSAPPRRAARNTSTMVAIFHEATMALDMGVKLGPYELTGSIGAGGMGEVYRAHDRRLGRDVAVKIIPRSFASDASRVRRFEQEARAAAALNHPNILAVYDIGTHDDCPYIVSELLEGQSLRDRLRDGALPVRKVIDYALQTAHGLAAAHDRGIVHRDLKPDNIFITDDGRVKILDFGLAKLTRRKPGSTTRQERWRGIRARCWEPLAICRPNRCEARRPTRARTCVASGPCSTR